MRLINGTPLHTSAPAYRCHGESKGRAPSLRGAKITTHTLFTRLTLYTRLSKRNNFHIFCRQVTIIAKSTINQAWTWTNITPRLPGWAVERVAQH
eukprot:364174-Chlamydomonas_euryale.AAC.6